MKIFIDIGHPAHVHYFKNFIRIMTKKGHSFLVTARDKEMTHYLLQKEKIKYVNRGSGRNSLIGKFFYMIEADYFIYKYAKKFNPDIFLGFASFYTAQVSYLLNKPSIVLDDTENGLFQQLCYRPFADSILSPSTFSKNFGEKHVNFNSYLELSYLHPDYFSPNIEALSELGIKKGEKFTICRFVSWNANHDYGHSGLSTRNKIRAVNKFREYGKVFISSESELPEEIKKYQIKLSPEKIHHAISFASLLYGESATMASEAAVLGTPSVYVDNVGRGYTDEQESQYGIVHNFKESAKGQEQSILKGIEILKINDSDLIFNKIRKDILSNKINFTDFLVWYVEEYPESFNEMSTG